MTSNHIGPSRSQKIFSMNLEVETVSLYLLCCAVADTGSEITKETLMDKWNGSAEALTRELDFLVEKKILGREESDGITAYRIFDEKKWQE
jgi:hypothetical protein